MKSARYLAAVCLLALCAGCGAKPSIQGLTDSSVVVAFGDSLTSGTGASEAESYPSILSGILGSPVVNAGVVGEVTSAGLRRLPGVLAKESPQLVILCHGGNDMLNRLDPQETVDNLNAMISMVKDAGADVILLGVPKPGLRLKSEPFYKEIAEKHHIPFDADTIPQILSSPALKSDHAHPNAAGNTNLAQSVADLIRDSRAN